VRVHSSSSSAMGVVRVVDVDQPPWAVTIDTQTRHAFVAGGTGAASHNNVTMIDAATGRIVRTVPADLYPTALAIDERTERAFVVNSAATTVGVVDTRSGRSLRAVSVPLHPLHVVIASADGRAFVTGFAVQGGAEQVSVLDTTSGRLLRTVTVGPPATGGPATAAIAMDEGTHHAFVVTGNGVSVLDTRSGSPLHHIRFVVGTTVAVTVASRTHRVFITMMGRPMGTCASPSCALAGSGVVMLDARTGQLQRTVTVGSLPWTLAVDERTSHVFVADRGNNDSDPGRVYMLDTRSGQLLRTTAVSKGPDALAVDTRRGRIVVVGSATDILDATTGALIGAIGVVGNAVAIDEHAGHALVAASGGTQLRPNPLHQIPLVDRFFPGALAVRTSSKVSILDYNRFGHN